MYRKDSVIESAGDSANNERILMRILDNIDAIIYVSDIDTSELLFVNETMKKEFGIQNVTGKCWDVFQHNRSSQCDFCPIKKLNGIDDPPIVWEEYNSITGRYYQNTDRLIEWVDGKVVHIQYSIDITEQKKSTSELIEKQNDLEEALEKLRDASKSKDEFLSKMSHELRTPLNAIIGMLSIAQKSNDFERVKNSLTKMMFASKNLLQIINDILDISKIEAGKMELYNHRFNIEDMFRNIFNIVEFSAHEKKIDISIDIPGEGDSYFIGDAKRLSQVYMNLLSNAIKFTDPGGKIDVSVEYKEHDNGKTEIISGVTDSGVGIPEEKLHNLFESFVQVDNGLSRQYTGTGLGLVIAKNIVEMMGGKIKVESTVGVKTVFSFNIFLDKTDNREKPEVMTDVFNVLVIDDSEETCEYLHTLFDIRNIKHKTALSGPEGLEIAKREQAENGGFNIVLVDYYMDDMNGIETAKELRSILNKESIIIMISSIDWAEIEDMAKDVGINTFLHKPLLPSDVINSMNEVFVEHIKTYEVSETENYNFKGCKILLFEDIEINREIVQFLLEDTGVEIVEAEDGEVGIEKYFSDPESFDLILMDIQMPKMDGFEATKIIRAGKTQNSDTIPIIAMTANVFANQIRSMIRSGMNSHLGKPIDEKEMKREIAKYLVPILRGK